MRISTPYHFVPFRWTFTEYTPLCECCLRKEIRIEAPLRGCSALWLEWLEQKATERHAWSPRNVLPGDRRYSRGVGPEMPLPAILTFFLMEFPGFHSLLRSATKLQAGREPALARGASYPGYSVYKRQYESPIITSQRLKSCI